MQGGSGTIAFQFHIVIVTWHCSAGRCRGRRRLGSRLQGTPLRAARGLRLHTKEGVSAGSQPRVPRPRPPPAPRSHPFSPDHPLPRADAEEGRGAGPRVTRTRDTNWSVRGLPRRPRPQAAQSLHQLGLGSRAPPAGRTQGGGRVGTGVPSTHCCLELCVRIDGGRNKRSDWLVIGFHCEEDS